MKWKKIKSSKDLPHPCQDILITDGNTVYIGWLETYAPCEEPLFFSLFAEGSNWVENITHWMPLPEAPKQDD